MAAPTSPSPTSRPHASPQLHNPLSIRLYKVLAANFDDEATKDALGTLAELYASPTSAAFTGTLNLKAPPKPKRDRSVGSAGDDEDDEVDDAGVPPAAAAAPTLQLQQQQLPAEGVAGEIAARARKNLRRDVESKLAESSRRFLTAFAEVDKVRLT